MLVLNDSKNKVFINEYFYEYLNDKSRYFVLYGGAGSGKSHFAAQKLLARCLNEKNHRILIVRKVAKTIKESVYKQIHSLIAEYGLTKIVTENKTDMSFQFSNGNEIITTGLDDPEKIKSIYNITSIWIEEATELEKGDFDQLDLRLRNDSVNYKQIIFSFNPVSETHWIKAELFDNQVENCTLLHSTYKNNSFLDTEYIDTLNKRVANDENLHRIYVLGEWGRIITGAEYYTAFNRLKHVKEVAYKHELPLHPTYDQNIVPYISCVVAQIEKKDDIYYVNCINELALSNPKNSTKWLCNEFLNLYPAPGHIYYYGDASGNKQDTRNNQTDYDIIRTNFSKWISNSSDRTLRINPPHKKRRQFINAILNDKLPIRITIDPKCKLLITDLEYVKEDIDGGTLKEKAKNKQTGQSYEKYGHLSDAFCYLLIQAFRSYYDSFQAFKI